VFGPKGEEVTGGPELRALHFSRSVIWVMLRKVRRARHVARVEEDKIAYRALVGKREGNTAWKTLVQME